MLKGALQLIPQILLEECIVRIGGYFDDCFPLC